MHSSIILAIFLATFHVTAAAYKLDYRDGRGKDIHHWAEPWNPWTPHGGADSDSKAHKNGLKAVHKTHTPLAPSHHSPLAQESHTKRKTKHRKPSQTSTQKHHSSAHGKPGPTAHPTDYAATVIHHHNVHRNNHSAPAIQWDSGLASTAAEIASSCVYAHNTKVNGGGYGQNIAAGIAAPEISHVISDMFYNSEVNWFHGLYGEAHPDMSNFEHWGHFSQVVWKASTHVGCATQYCPNGLANTGGHVHPYFTVCNYQGHGNVAGRYADNVGRPLGRPTVHGAGWADHHQH